MAAYDILIDLVKNYFIDLGYNNNYIDYFISPRIFKEMISIRLANANVMIKNKTDRSSHQTHIAITGESVEFFFDLNDFIVLDNKIIEKRVIAISEANIQSLLDDVYGIDDTNDMVLIEGQVTIGKRTQRQLQLSKRNSENSAYFNALRLGLFENDLLILLKFRENDKIFAIGIPQIFYLDYIPDYASKYETNTYLKMPFRYESE